MAQRSGSGSEGFGAGPGDERAQPPDVAGSGRRLLTGDDVTAIVVELWRLRDAVARSGHGQEFEAAVEELGRSVESLRVSVEELAQRTAFAEEMLERLQRSESYRIGNLLVATAKAPLRIARRLRRGQFRRALGPSARTTEPLPGGWRTGSRDDGAPTVVCLMVAIPVAAARRWLRVIAEAAVLSGGFRPVFVVDADLDPDACGFPVVQVIAEADWSRRSSGAWNDYVQKRVVGVVRAYSPARLAGLAGALGPVPAGEVNGLLHLLTDDETLGAAIRPARIAG